MGQLLLADPRDLVALFGERLLAQKTRAQLTYRELGARAKFSHTHMVRADRGKELPSWEVAEAYLRACGVISGRSLMVFQALWVNAARSVGLEAQSGRAASRKAAAASMKNIRSNEEFGELLRRLAQRGSPVRKVSKPKSLRQLAKETEISKSTLADWFAGNRLPSHSRLQELAVAIEVTQSELTELLATRQRLDLAAHEISADSALILDNPESDINQHTFQQLASALLLSAEQRDRAAAVRTVGARAVTRFQSAPVWSPEDSGAPGRHRAAPTPEQLGREQAALETLAKRLAELLAAAESRRLRDPASLPRLTLKSAGKRLRR